MTTGKLFLESAHQRPFPYSTDLPFQMVYIYSSTWLLRTRYTAFCQQRGRGGHGKTNGTALCPELSKESETEAKPLPGYLNLNQCVWNTERLLKSPVTALLTCWNMWRIQMKGEILHIEFSAVFSTFSVVDLYWIIRTQSWNGCQKRHK